MKGTLKNSLKSVEMEHLKHEAEILCSQGVVYAGQEDFTAAEQTCLGALRLLQRLLEETGDSGYGQSAGELCEILADIQMQQGNMHGADRYYVEAQRFRKMEGWSEEEKNRGEGHGT